jgi:hypothetical protein
LWWHAPEVGAIFPQARAMVSNTRS